jgi:hypothetical protein
MLFTLKSLSLILTIGMATLLTTKQLFNNSEQKSIFNFIAISWILLTITAFIVPTIWAFAAVTIFLFIQKKGKEAALFAFPILIISFPPVGQEIPGLGLARYIFTLTPARLFTLTLIAPIAIKLIKSRSTKKFGSTFVDKSIIAFILLDLIIYSRFRSISDNFRTIAITLIDVVIPYYVYSRAIDSRKIISDVAIYFVTGAAIAGFTGLFEAINGWQTYASVPINWDADASLMSYLQRDGILRGLAGTGHALILGYISVLAIGLWSNKDSNGIKNWRTYILLAGVAGGLLASFSRGSWLAVVILLMLYYATKNRAIILEAIKPIAVIALGFAVAAQTPYWGKMKSFLPFIGTVDTFNADYRQRLLEYSLQILSDSPFFGNPYFINFLEDLRQGQGIIDIVNSYIGIALRMGYVGLALFLAGFIYNIIFLYLQKNVLNDTDYQINRKLIATTCGILILISSVSSIGIITFVYWMILGIGSSTIAIASHKIHHAPNEK